MTPQQWASALHASAARTLGERPIVPDACTFRDERASRLAVDEPFLCALAGRALPAASAPLGPDELLWRAAAGDASIDVDSLICSPGEARAPVLAALQGQRVAIEVYTERLLCATHALWRLARARNRPEWRDRCAAGCAWLIENLQPDNATNYPWGVHVLVLLTPRLGIDADLYAQALLHNCQVMLGRPDVRSAWVLQDAAAELQRAINPADA
jgi:hypothetical protein